MLCDPSQEPSQRDGSNDGSQHSINDGSQHMFPLKNKKKYL